MTLEELREEIDILDANILQLLNQRAQYVIKVGEIKRKHSEEVSVPEREKEIMERLSCLNKGPLKNENVHKLFQQVIDTMKSLQ